METRRQVTDNFPSITLSETSPGFYVSAVQVLKILWEKEKLLVGSNHFFPYSVYYLFGGFSAIYQNCLLLTLSVSKSLKFIVWERVN